MFGSITDIRLRLARLSVDDATGIDTQVQDKLYLGLRSAVESGAEIGHEAKNFEIGVAFDSCQSSVIARIKL